MNQLVTTDWLDKNIEKVKILSLGIIKKIGMNPIKNLKNKTCPTG